MKKVYTFLVYKFCMGKNTVANLGKHATIVAEEETKALEYLVNILKKVKYDSDLSGLISWRIIKLVDEKEINEEKIDAIKEVSDVLRIFCCKK